MGKAFKFFATSARGTEEVLAQELRQILDTPIEKGRGGASWSGPLETGYKACLHSRVASRVLLQLRMFDAPSPDALYEGMQKIDWSNHLDVARTLAIDAVSTRSQIGHSRFAALKAKDAIVDQFRLRTGDRPSIDTTHPDLRINLHIANDKATVSIDLSGPPLHRRGVGRDGARAPLKENLAAALLMMAGWPEMAKNQVPLLDPMCGSGTLLIEGAWMALGIAPGLHRAFYGFKGWKGHQIETWNKLVREARAHAKEVLATTELQVFGNDRDARTLEIARKNVHKAGLTGIVRFKQSHALDVRAPEDAVPGLLMVNPPYGERLGDLAQLGPLYEGLGDMFRRHYPGWKACILTGHRDLARQVGLKASRKHPVFNGPIECRLLEYPISKTPVVDGGEGPGWRKPSKDAQMFVNRVKKNLKRLRKWAKKNDIHCYRAYDADIPEYNVALDWYDGQIHIQEYARPRSVPVDKAERRLKDVIAVAPEIFGVTNDEVHVKVRSRGRNQYGQLDEQKQFIEAREGGLFFYLNMTDYLDTGIFLDQRKVRAQIQKKAEGKNFLNLFSYTCTASVYAAEGGAKSTTSVDLSRTYLDWGRRNMSLNGLVSARHRFIREDCLEWLAREQRKYDLIYVAPPIFSNSKSMQDTFDVQRDHVEMLRDIARILAPGGEIIFSNPYRQFVMDRESLPGLEIRDISKSILPLDFERNPRIQNTWSIRHQEG